MWANLHKEKKENKESTCTEEHWKPLPVLVQIVWELTTWPRMSNGCSQIICALSGRIG